MAYNKDTGMYEGYIYKITNNINNHFYIGQTRTTILERFKDHKKDYAIKKYEKYGLYKAFKKYGIHNFHIEELEKYECNTESELKDILNDREHFLIVDAKLKYGKSYIYNHSDGGDYDGCSTERTPVIQYDLFCNEIDRFNSIKEAKYKTGCSSISSVVNKYSQSLSSGGYIWRKQDDPITEDEKINLKIHFDTMNIKQYCGTSEVLNEFKNSEEAALFIINLFPNMKNNSINTIKTRIRQCCSGTHDTAYGFVWRYGNDEYIYDDSYKKCVLAVEQRENGTGKLVNTFISVSEAERMTHINGSTISLCCNHQKLTAGGFIWNRCGDYNPIILKNIPIKPIVQLTINGDFINQFSSAKMANKSTGINRGDIIGVCKGSLKTAGGYKWKYLYDYLNIFKNKEVKHENN